MSAISTLPSAYYQLSNPTAGTATSQPDPTDALLQALSQPTDGTSSSTDSSAFLLDLSPQAQQILNGLGINGQGGASSSADIFGNSGSFLLSGQQQQTISSILAKYKDAPYTQDTFNQIQTDLQAAGLNPNILSLEDQAKSFDPALILLDALNGTSANSSLFGSTTGAASEQTKSSGFMQQIIKQWQSISTTYRAQANSAAVPAS